MIIMIKQSNRVTGKIKWYSEKKGYGFISSEKLDEDVFLHRSALQNRDETCFYTGDRISFTIKKQKKGFAAMNAKKLVENEYMEQSDEEIKDIFFTNLAPSNNQVEKSVEQSKRCMDTSFKDLELMPELLRAVSDAGYVEPTPIQVQAIPPVLKGRDLLGCAQTGTGKTAAFALPILQQLKKSLKIQKDEASGKSKINQKKRRITALIIAPTRELAIQIKDSFNTYGKYTGLRSTVIYGGVGQNPQVQQLKRGVDIVAATPGRLLDLIRQGHVDLRFVEVFVLDEGDRMLDMGFIPDVRRIVEKMPRDNRQTLLFSATLPREIVKLAKSIQKNALEIKISPEKPTLDIINQVVCFISKKKKQSLLEYLLANPAFKRVLVFMRTKRSANRVVRDLTRKGINAEPIHGNKSQTARQRALKNFRKGKTRVLIATDVAARGIDVDDITHVIQYDLPDVPKTYVHRIGRTARAGAGGTAIAFCEKKNRSMLKEIEKLIQMRIRVFKNHPFAN
ncbi:MAG: DEAD/DEAH box helicase [Candidatus Lokiarchaeota archaeon]|nr:DEAD/DEAH box helicase [Candidatus Lokiarchaeota archaeon]